MQWPEARARLDRGGRRQLVEITVRGGYRPAAIVARAGVPLRVVFRRDDHDACTERVIFSAPRLDRRLLPVGTTTVDLPAQPAGQIRFTCGMGRYRGRIDLVEPGLPRLVAGLRDLLVGGGTLVGTALVLAGGLLLIAAATALLLDLRPAQLVVGLAVLAWAIGCLWVFRRSASAT